MNAPKPQPRKRYPGEDDRATLAAGYRHLADLIESGAAPIPTGVQVDFFFTDLPADEQPAAARDLMRALGGGKYDKDDYGDSLQLEGMCGGLPVQIWVDRDAVCERVVVGTETVEVPEQPAREAVPAHTETREVIEWRCSPILAADTEAGAR